MIISNKQFLLKWLFIYNHMRYNVYLQTITYVRKFFTNHEKNCTKNVHIIFLHLAPHSALNKSTPPVLLAILIIFGIII